MRPFSLLPTLVLLLLWIAGPGTPATAEGIYVDTLMQEGGSIPKGDTTWQLLPLNAVDQYLVCVFGTNSQGKKCKAGVVARGYLASRDGPLTAFRDHGGFSTTLRLKSGGSGSAFDQSCFISTPAAGGADHLVIRFDWNWKSCRKLARNSEGVLGAVSQEWLPAESARLEANGAEKSLQDPLAWRSLRR